MMGEVPRFEERLDDHESERQEPYTCLEIGSGWVDMLTHTQHRANRLMSDPNYRYIAVDSSPEKLGKGIENSKGLTEGLSKKILHINADARNLPIKGESVDEIVMRDVLGDPRVSESSQYEIMNEAIAALKPGGKLIIFEFSSPAYSDENLQYIATAFATRIKLVEELRNNPEAQAAIRWGDIESDEDYFYKSADNDSQYMRVYEKLQERD